MDQRKLLKKIKKELENDIDVSSLYLFGSRARGDSTPDSDYDLAIISSDFKRLSFMKRQGKVRAHIRKVLGYVAIDVACYTPEEYARGKKGFLPEIIEKEGIEV